MSSEIVQVRLAALRTELACDIRVIHCFFMLAVAAFTEMIDSPYTIWNPASSERGRLGNIINMSEMGKRRTLTKTKLGRPTHKNAISGHGLFVQSVQIALRTESSDRLC